MNKLPVWFERTEGALICFGASGLYFVIHGNLLFYVLALISIDLSIIGYLAGPRIGAITYNMFHSFTLPIMCITLGLLSSSTVALGWFGMVWIAHIGLDRALGFGLKYPDSFKHTHLGMIGRANRKN